MAGRFGNAYVFLVARELCWMNFCVFFLVLNLTSFQYILFFGNLSSWLSSLFFRRNLPRKFPRNSRKIGRFLREFVSKNPAKFDFFSRELSEALCSNTNSKLTCPNQIALCLPTAQEVV